MAPGMRRTSPPISIANWRRVYARQGKAITAATADFKNVVAVLDEARKIGISKVGISTEKK